MNGQLSLFIVTQDESDIALLAAKARTPLLVDATLFHNEGRKSVVLIHAPRAEWARTVVGNRLYCVIMISAKLHFGSVSIHLREFKHFVVYLFAKPLFFEIGTLHHLFKVWKAYLEAGNHIVQFAVLNLFCDLTQPTKVAIKAGNVGENPSAESRDAHADSLVKGFDPDIIYIAASASKGQRRAA